MVRDVLFDIFRRVGVPAKKETLMNFLTDPLKGRSIFRSIDILVFGWAREKHARVNLTGVSRLVGLGSEVLTVGQAALKVAPYKLAKHEKTYMKNQHTFILFAFDTFGFPAPDILELITRVQQVMHRCMYIVLK